MISVPGLFDGLGWAFASSTVEGNCGLWGTGNSLVNYAGIGSADLAIKWHLVAQAGSNCECTERIPPNLPPCNSRYRYCALGKADMDTTIAVTIEGVPVGDPVLIQASWYSLINNAYDPENDGPPPDDPADVNVTFNRVGTDDLIAPGTGLINNSGLLLLPAGGGNGFITAFGGDTIVFTIKADVEAAIEYEPKVCLFHQDRSEAAVHGQLLLTLDQAPPWTFTPPYAYAPGTFAEFSLDIGSDTEMSDPFVDGDEVFDPGDMYAWGGAALPPGGQDGLRDDALIFGADYWPQAPDGPPPATAADTCQATNPIDDILNGSRFDLDGSDTIGTDLVLIIPPLAPAAPVYRAQHNIPCVYRPDNLVVSFDDDDRSHYHGATGYCGTPVTSSGEFDSRPTFGTTTKRDEIAGVLTLPAVTPTLLTQLVSTYPVLDESSLHVSLSPNPDLAEADDDDVDALDAANAGCQWWYFSPDHEATGQAGLLNLDPGSIYRVNPLGGSPVKVIDDLIHLGLDEATDIDAFEFVWLQDLAGGGGEALAVLFSVAPDDWLTPTDDEDGGLDPAQLYASFMNGTHFAYLGVERTDGTTVFTPFDDDVDALTASPVPFLTAPCLPAAKTILEDGFESYPAGQVLAGSGGWELWPDPASTGAEVFPGQAHTGLQSMLLSGGDDIVQQPMTNPLGTWIVTLYSYVASSAVGEAEINLLNNYDPINPGSMPPAYWSIRLHIDASNASLIEGISGNGAPLLYDQWIPIRAEIDFTGDTVSLFYNNALFHTGAWTHGSVQADLNLAAMEFKGGTISGMHIDDVNVSGLRDCNSNLVADVCDIATGTSTDCQNNGLPDECDPVIPDFDGDGDIDRDDYREFQSCITGPCPSPACGAPLYARRCCHLADGDSDGDVDLLDAKWFQDLFTGP